MLQKKNQAKCNGLVTEPVPTPSKSNLPLPWASMHCTISKVGRKSSWGNHTWGEMLFLCERWWKDFEKTVFLFSPKDFLFVSTNPKTGSSACPLHAPFSFLPKGQIWTDSTSYHTVIWPQNLGGIVRRNSHVPKENAFFSSVGCLETSLWFSYKLCFIVFSLFFHWILHRRIIRSKGGRSIRIATIAHKTCLFALIFTESSGCVHASIQKPLFSHDSLPMLNVVLANDTELAYANMYTEFFWVVPRAGCGSNTGYGRFTNLAQHLSKVTSHLFPFCHTFCKLLTWCLRRTLPCPLAMSSVYTNATLCFVFKCLFKYIPRAKIQIGVGKVTGQPGFTVWSHPSTKSQLFVCLGLYPAHALILYEQHSERSWSNSGKLVLAVLITKKYK